jgi:predicted nucleic-acid-binding Zn-ribbon protein
MKCPQCGTEYREVFKICADCKVDLVKPEPNAAEEIYACDNDTIGEIVVNGMKMTCPVCAGKVFSTKRFMLNTRLMTFLNWDWTDKTAINKICENCGYVFWFVKK